MSRGLRRALRAGAGPARRLRHRLDGPIVRPLTTDDAPGLRAILDADPVTHLFAAEHLERTGLPRPSRLAGMRTASPFLGVLDADGGAGLLGAVWFGANLVPLRLSPEHAPAVAAWVRATRRPISSLFGPAEQVLPLWEALREDGGLRAFDVRPEQPLLALAPTDPDRRGLRSRRDRARLHDAGVSPVRWAEGEDVSRLFPAAVAMFTEEVGYSPLERDPQGYRQRVIEGVMDRRTVLALDEDGAVVFKTDVGLAHEGVCQLQGVWLDPRLRGRGLSEPLLRQACSLIGARYDTISLYVNSYNAPARALYRAVGFERIGTFATVLL